VFVTVLARVFHVDLMHADIVPIACAFDLHVRARGVPATRRRPRDAGHATPATRRRPRDADYAMPPRRRPRDAGHATPAPTQTTRREARRTVGALHRASAALRQATTRAG
jgi:hypothetical protein